MAEVSGGSVCAGMADAWPVKSEPGKLIFRIGRFNAMMGANIPRETIVDTLVRLGCTVDAAKGNVQAEAQGEAQGGSEGVDTADVLNVVAPTFRPDLEREIDLYEEVLRVFGMDRIEATLPGGRGRVGSRSAQAQKTAIVHTSLRASGLNETMTYSFAEPGDMARLRMAAGDLGHVVELINPINADQSVMRQSIIPGLLKSVAYNQSHGVKDIQLYEIGAVYLGVEGKRQPKEKMRLAAVLAGAMGGPGWNVQPAAFDFFDGKGAIESLCRELAVPRLHFKALTAGEAPHLQPGRGAAVWSGGSPLGWVGELHPQAVEAFEAAAPVVAFELDFGSLLKASQASRAFQDIPVFPAVAMDVAFVVDEDVTHEKLMQCMQSAGAGILESAVLFDVYRDERRVGIGKKSMAYALTYRAPDRTLTGKEVEKAHERLIGKVKGASGAQVRG